MTIHTSTLHVKILGMHCKGCETLLTDIITEIPGVEKAQVSVQRSEATIVFDKDRICESRLKKLVQDAAVAEGYKTE